MKGAIWYYQDKQAAMSKLLRIKDGYEKLKIPSINARYGKNEGFITFANGDSWSLVRAVDSSRGCKVNISYISADIPERFIREVIQHCTIAYPYTAYHFY